MNDSTIHYQAAGKFTSRGAWIHPACTIDTDELIVVTEGHFRMEEDGNIYALRPGQVLRLDAGLAHRGIGVTEETVSFYWVHCTPLPSARRENIGKCFALTAPDAVSLLIRQLLHYAENGAPQEVTDGLLMPLLFELQTQNAALRPDERELTARVAEWLRINADRPLTAQQVAGQFGYNADYLSRLFRARYGYGIKTAIARARLSLIRSLLIDTRLTVTEIADRAGFGDSKLMSKFFVYHEKMTPTAFREVYFSMHTNNR